MKAVTRKVTEDSVDKACADLTNSGVKPTVAAVRARIGGGSANEIAVLIKKWKEFQCPWPASAHRNSGITG